MKLASHYNRATIIVTLFVLMIGAVIYYFAINHIAKSLLDDHLSEEVSEVVGYINQNKKLPKQVDFDEDQTSFTKLNGNRVPTRFYDTIYSNPKLKIERTGRAVEGTLKFNNEFYKFRIIISKESTEYLVQVIPTITLLLFLGLLTVLFLTNRYLLRDLWKPFYRILTQLKAFNVSESIALDSFKSKVDEFNELDDAVHLMARQVKDDYQNLKHLTENASHEMLTPLSVITSKLDTFIQDDTLRQEQFEQIQDIYSAVGKLSRFNQSLLLLVKIENDLITGAERLHLDELLAEKQRQFQELLISREITLHTSVEPKVVTVNRYLIEILLNNLFSNAIRHNTDNGEITIELTSTQLVFINSGNVKPLDPQVVFNRFQKGKNSEGVGLGLTIVKNICNVYGWSLNYRYADGLHNFIIVF